MKFNLSIFVLFLLSIQVSEAQEGCPQSFDASVNQTFHALDNRDLEAYMGTIPPREDQLMILPDGSTWSTRNEIEQFHDAWFKDPTWVFERTLIRKDVRTHWGVGVYRVNVVRPDSAGTPFVLSMMFAPESDGCWYLQHDQNTLLPKDK